MEKRHRLRPLVRLELPRLARRQDAHHPVPRVAPEFHERVDAVYDVIPRLRTALLAGGVDVREGAVDGDDVLRTLDPLRCCALARFVRVFEPV